MERPSSCHVSVCVVVEVFLLTVHPVWLTPDLSVLHSSTFFYLFLAHHLGLLARLIILLSVWRLNIMKLFSQFFLVL